MLFNCHLKIIIIKKRGVFGSTEPPSRCLPGAQPEEPSLSTGLCSQPGKGQGHKRGCSMHR